MPQVFKALKEAKIKTWILTGDSLNTAVQTAKTSTLIPRNATVVYVQDSSFEQVERRLQMTLKQTKLHIHTLVVDGPALQLALSQPSTKMVLLRILSQVEVAIFSRLTPT